MDRDKKITLSLFLTWVVFGLFNLFGQPQAFVPPIIVDGLIIAGLGFYFFFPISRNYFHFAILCFTIFILFLSSMELGWIEITMTNAVIGLCINILFVVYLLLGAISLFTKEKLITFILIIIILSHSISITLALIQFFPFGKYLALIIYSITAFSAAFSLFLMKNENPILNSLKRLYLIIILHFAFDIGNYLALLQFTSN
jgi:hypothetical protein